MKIEVNVEKKYFFGLMVIGLVILGVVGVVAYNSAAVGGNPAVFGHSVDEIDWTKTIQGNLSVNGIINAARFCIGTNCITSWPMGGGVGGNLNIIAGSGILITQSNGNVTISATGGGGGSQWTTETNGINYSGNVGIGAAAQSDKKLYINGSFKVDGPYANSGEDNYSAWKTTNTQNDNCPGSSNQVEYNCTPEYSGICRDVKVTGSTNYNRTVTCVASKSGFGVYDGNGIVLNEAVRIFHVAGSNPTCPNGSNLMKKIAPKTCGSPNQACAGDYYNGCTLSGGWGGGDSCTYCDDCRYSTQIGHYCGSTKECKGSWTEVLCVGTA